MNDRLRSVKTLINPKSIAIIGAGDNALRINGRALMFMLRHKCSAKILPVNPKRDSVQGVKCYRKIDDIPQIPDVALVIVAKKLVPSVLNDLGIKGCRIAIVTSAGYAETGEAGKNDQEHILSVAKEHGMRLMGPNCLGLVNLNGPVILSWCATLERDPGEVLKGDVALISQSGALLGSIWDRAIRHNLGYSSLLSTGNEADLGLSDFVEYFAYDDQTKLITCFVEGLRKPEAFLKAVELCHSKKKPVILYKVGRSKEGAAAAASHTGALTGSDETFEAMCKANGIIRVDSIDSLATTAQAVRTLPAARGNRIGVFSCSGGAAGLISDKISNSGLELAKGTPEFEKKMTEILGWEPPHNPADIAKGPLASFDVISDAMQCFYEEDRFDQIIILMTMMYFQKVAPELMIKGIKKVLDKPVIACWLGDKIAEIPASKMMAAGIPTFHQVEPCLDAAKALHFLGRYRSDLSKRKNSQTVSFEKREKALEVIKEAGGKLDEYTSKKLLSLYGVLVPQALEAVSVSHAKEIANDIGYPVVLKAVSPRIFHKSDSGLIKVNLGSDRELKDAYVKIEKKVVDFPALEKKKILVEKCLAPPLFEVVVGAVSDEMGFHKMVFGLGGIFVEIMHDTSVRLAPLHPEDALDMIKETKCSAFFEGVRGNPRIEKKYVVNTLVLISQMVIDLKDEIEEIEINPLFVYEHETIAVDALVKLK